MHIAPTNRRLWVSIAAKWWISACDAIGALSATVSLPFESQLKTKAKVRPVTMIVKAEGPSGPAKIHSDDPKHALGLAQYLRTIGYNAWIEDTNGNEIEEKALKMAIRSGHEDAPSS